MSFSGLSAFRQAHPKSGYKLLRKAFADTMKDPEFIAEAEKSKLETTYVSGEEIEKYVDQVCRSLPKPKRLSIS